MLEGTNRHDALVQAWESFRRGDLKGARASLEALPAGSVAPEDADSAAALRRALAIDPFALGLLTGGCVLLAVTAFSTLGL